MALFPIPLIVMLRDLGPLPGNALRETLWRPGSRIVVDPTGRPVRPSDLAISALCQCNSIFALRLSNTADQEFVRAMLPDWGGGLFDFLPALRNGEAIVIGEAVPVPARVRFDTLPPEHMPCSKTAPFSEAWQTNGAGKDLLEGVIARWRAEH